MFAGGSISDFGLQAVSSLKLATNAGTVAMTIDTSQRVGIGMTPSGSTVLDVNGASTQGNMAILRGNRGSAAGAYLQFYDATNSATRGYVGYGTDLFSGGAVTDFGIYSQSTLKLAADAGVIVATIASDGATGYESYEQLFNSAGTANIRLGTVASNTLGVFQPGAASTVRVYGDTSTPKYTLLSHDGTNGFVGTNTDTTMWFNVNGSARWGVFASANAYALSPNASNSNDIGTTSNLVRTVYVGTSLNVGVATNTAGQIYSGTDGGTNLVLDTASATANLIRTRSSGGTQASRTDSANGNIMGRWISSPFSGATGYWDTAEIRSVVDGTFTSNQRPPARLEFYTNPANTAQTLRMTLSGDGGLQMGAPTGGSKGAGTINVSGAIYLNNTSYTNPDYALEKWATGQISTFAGNPGAQNYSQLTLEEVKDFAKTNYYLPQLDFLSAHGEAADIFTRSDVSLILHEDAYRFLFDHEDRVQALERKVADLEAQLKAVQAH
jgi:hypothetical protein